MTSSRESAESRPVSVIFTLFGREGYGSSNAGHAISPFMGVRISWSCCQEFASC